MIKWILLSLLTLNSYSQELKAFNSEQIVDSKKFNRVSIKICKAEMMGCVPSVRVDGEKINLDVSSLDPNYYSGLQSMKQTGVLMGMTIDSYGLVVKEAGHMPNPMVEQSVFKYIYKNNAILKICKLDESVEAIGCADSITIQTSLKDVEARADYSRVEISKDDYQNKKAFVIGYFTFEKGHMPNPLTSQHVFKVVKVSFSSDTESIISDDTKRGTNLKNLFESESHEKKTPASSSSADQR